MNLAVHEEYAKALLLSLPDSNSKMEDFSFIPDPSKSRNAARAMTAILCHRLFNGSENLPICKTGTTFEWKGGIFNCRNIADREYLWTNMRRGVANELHESARGGPAAYLLTCCKPADKGINVWAIPEPILYDSLESLPFEERGKKYTVEISAERQRIDRYSASPDLTSYFRRIELTEQELHILEASRGIDAIVKQERASQRGEEDAGDEDDEQVSQSETNVLLKATARQLDNEGNFDPIGVSDARERVVASIVRRRGQPAFRQRLLAAYDGRCAITGCGVESVLDAAHIVLYLGPETNHLGNGLLLRTDIHTLFDLKLLAVDVSTMAVVISPELAGTCYDQYRGAKIHLPDSGEFKPSPEALKQHHNESGL